MNNSYNFPFQLVNESELISGENYYIKLNNKIIEDFIKKRRKLPVTHLKGTFVRLHTETEQFNETRYAIFTNIQIINKNYKIGHCTLFLVRYPDGILASTDCNNIGNKEVYFDINKWIFGLPIEENLLVKQVTREILEPNLNEDVIGEISKMKGIKLLGGGRKRKKTLKKNRKKYRKKRKTYKRN